MPRNLYAKICSGSTGLFAESRERFLLLLLTRGDPAYCNDCAIDVRFFTVAVEVLRQGSRQGNRVEVSAQTSPSPAPSVGPDQMGLHRAIGDERGVRGGGHARHLRRLQPGVHAIRPVPVLVVDNPVAGDIRPTGQCASLWCHRDNNIYLPTQSRSSFVARSC